MVGTVTAVTAGTEGIATVMTVMIVAMIVVTGRGATIVVAGPASLAMIDGRVMTDTGTIDGMTAESEEIFTIVGIVEIAAMAMAGVTKMVLTVVTGETVKMTNRTDNQRATHVTVTDHKETTDGTVVTDV